MHASSGAAILSISVGSHLPIFCYTVYFGAPLSCHRDRWSSPTCQHKVAFHKRRSTPRHEFQILISVKPIIIWWRRLFSSPLLLGLELYPCLFSMVRSLRFCMLYTAIILNIPLRSSARNQFSFPGFIKFYGHISSPCFNGCFKLHLIIGCGSVVWLPFNNIGEDSHWILKILHFWTEAGFTKF